MIALLMTEIFNFLNFGKKTKQKTYFLFKFPKLTLFKLKKGVKHFGFLRYVHDRIEDKKISKTASR